MVEVGQTIDLIFRFAKLTLKHGLVEFDLVLKSLLDILDRFMQARDCCLEHFILTTEFFDKGCQVTPI